MMKEFYVSELLFLMQTFFNMLLYVYSDDFSRKINDSIMSNADIFKKKYNFYMILTFT